MSRRSSTSSDSLELLLDTICNTFGGVLFIAILVIVMLQLSGEPTSTDSEDAAREAVRQQQLESQAAHLQSESSRLQSALEGQQKTLQEMVPQEMREQVAEQSRAAARRIELEAQQTHLRERLEQERKDRAALQAQEEQLPQDVSEVQSAIDDLETQLVAARKKRHVELKTTQVHSPGFKDEVQAVLQYDRFYLLHEYNSDGVSLGLNLDDFVVLSDESLELEITPNPLAGTPVNDLPPSTAAIRRQLQRFSPNGDYIAVVVRPDSFDSFKVLREMIVDLDFKYRLIPVSTTETVTNRGGSGMVQ